jgi:ATP-dependent helicase/nuclease subunit B
LYNNNSKYIYDKNIESIEKFSRALSEFLRILDEMIYILKDRSNNKMTLIELIEQLKLSVSSSKYQTREKLNYGVTVTVVEQIREIPFKITILCGLNDGIFPMPYRPESFLGKELHDSEERHLHSEQIQFYQYLINGADEIPHNEKQIFLTYSKFSNQYETARSTFIDSLLKVTNLENMSCLVQVNNENSDLIQKYPWLFSTSNRPEIAEYFAGQKAANADENIIVDSSNNELEQIKLYINELSVRYQDISNNNLAYLDDFSKKYLKNISTKVFSASEFETYSKCSYKYFAQKVLRLKEKESESNIIEPADFGNIMHSALYKFYLKLQKQSNEEWLQTNTLDGYELPLLKPVNINKFNKNDLVLLLMETISAEFEDVKFAHPYILLSKREILGNNEIIGWAEKFIDSEYDRVNTFNSYPSLFELEFGFGNGPNKIPAINIGYDIKLRGKIDRIEFSQNTSVASSNDLLFTTVDYKSSTSGTSTNKDIQNGFSFQMPLYSLAISKIITEFYGLNADLKAAVYYILKPKIAKDKKDDTKLTLFPINYSINTDNKNIKYLNDVAEQIELLDNSLNNAKEIIENIVLAKFSANPRNVNICKYCDFLAVCRKNERSILLVDDDDDDLISNSDDNV